jgi:thiamine-monophosphate kinase
VSLGEFAIIERLRAALGEVRDGVGIGDDGAVLAGTTAADVVVVDTMVEGVHFRWDWSSWADVGSRLVVANASDVFAMGAAPVGYFVAITAPSLTGEDVAALASGMRSAVDALAPRIPLLGGDTTAGALAVLTITMLGRLDGPPLRRDAARPGQRLWCDGPLGWSRAGLDALERGLDADPVLRERFVRGNLAPSRWDLDRGGATAGIDISDGLALDLWRLARASGVHLEIDLPLPGRDMLLGAGIPADVAEGWQVGGGEDFVRVFAAPRAPGPQWAPIGRVVEGRPGLTAVEPGGTRRPLPPSGYVHFAASPREGATGHE